MNDFIANAKGKELVVRKRVASILEKLLRCCRYDFRHDIYKQIVYGEIAYNTPFEEKVKNYYDAFHYILANRKNPLTKELLNKFFYLFNQTKVDEYMELRITSYVFHMQHCIDIEQFVGFHIFIYSELFGFEEDERLIISWMFLEYLLVKNDIPCIQLLVSDYDQYLLARTEYLSGNKMDLINLFENILAKAKFQTIEFKENLTMITTNEIIEGIKFEESMIKEKYRIKQIYLFGSFAKELSRIDSDIDLLAMFNDDVTHEEKLQIINELSMHYGNKFHRYIDVCEISTYMTDDFLKEHTRIIKIFEKE